MPLSAGRRPTAVKTIIIETLTAVHDSDDDDACVIVSSPLLLHVSTTFVVVIIIQMTIDFHCE